MKKLGIALLLAAAVVFGGVQTPQAVTAAASISGVVWEDRNFDGIRQADEPPMAGISLVLEGPSTERQTFVAVDGSYRFDGLEPGQYVINTYATIQTYPSRTFNEVVTRNISLVDEALSGIDFGVTNSVPRVNGNVWINGTEAPRSQVLAFVGNTVCGSAPPGAIGPTDTGPSYFQLAFAPPGFLPGCEAGSTVQFRVNGAVATETLLYPPVIPAGRGSGPLSPPSPNTIMPTFLSLTFGPSFARYYGDVPRISTEESVYLPGELRAVVNGMDCGIPQFAFGPFHISVLPAELRPGCAVEGSVVEFYFGDVRANETVLWTPGVHTIELTVPDTAFVPRNPDPGSTPPLTSNRPSIAPPDAGDAGLLVPEREVQRPSLDSFG